MLRQKILGSFAILLTVASVAGCKEAKSSDKIVEWYAVSPEEKSGIRVNCTKEEVIRDTDDAPAEWMEKGIWYNKDSVLPRVKLAREKGMVFALGSVEEQAQLMFKDSFIDWSCKKSEQKVSEESADSSTDKYIVAVTDFNGDNIGARYNCETKEIIRDDPNSIVANFEGNAEWEADDTIKWSMPSGEWFKYEDFEKEYYSKYPTRENAPGTFNLWIPSSECQKLLGEDWYRGFEF